MRTRKTLRAIVSGLLGLSFPLQSFAAANTLQDLNFTYDKAGNITKVVDNSASGAGTTTYTYDNLYRLTSASTTGMASGDYLQSYQYDWLGNLTQKSDVGSYTYGLTGYANPDAVTGIGSSAYAYDQAGNLTSVTGGGATTTYAWDHRSRMTAATIQSGGTQTSTATPAYVQSKLNTIQGNATNSVTFTSAVASGDLIVVALTVNSQTIASNAISDNKGNTYTKVAEAIHPNHSDHVAVFYAKNVAGGSSFVVTSNIGDNTLSAHEYSGVDLTAPLDKSSTAIGTSTTPTSGSVTVGTSSELYFGAAWSAGHLDTWTAGTGYTKREEQTNDTTFEREATEDKVVSTATTTTASFTTSTSQPWAIVLATFKPKVTTGNGATTTSSAYLYDASDARVSQAVKKGSGATTTTLYFNRYYETTGATTTMYVFAGDQLVATIEGTGKSTTTALVHTDQLGGTNAVSSATGSLAQLTNYYPYGDVRQNIKNTPTFDEKRKYIGQYQDDATSLSYLNARYYGGKNGQFVSEDPVSRDIASMQKMPWWILNVDAAAGMIDQTGFLSNPQMLNLYAYSVDNPIANKDPSGKVPVLLLQGAFLIYGAAMIWIDAKVIDTTYKYPQAFTAKDRRDAIVNLALDGATDGIAGGIGKIGGDGAGLIADGLFASLDAANVFLPPSGEPTGNPLDPKPRTPVPAWPVSADSPPRYTNGKNSCVPIQKLFQINASKAQATKPTLDSAVYSNTLKAALKPAITTKDKGAQP